MTIEFKNTEFVVYNGFCPPLGTITVPCRSFSYKFIPGIYILSGDIDEGGFALSYLLGGTCTKKQLSLFNQGEVFIDNQPISLLNLKNIGCYLGDHKNKKSQYLSVKKQVEYALRKSKLPYQAEDIRVLFHIDESIFEKPLNTVGITIWQCIAAIGFAKGKKLYSFPWFSSEMLTFYEKMFQFILPVLKENNCTVMIPATNFKKLDGMYDYEVNLNQLYMETVNQNP